ncbi:hypothetical protein ACT3SP_06530 [Brachybacterium sp. AOP43-C2-M15]|uniref:hypothetical protein n=1 Tax=Brachybacterium sp. AOP43-C2-M15 TaxID=3457661 RepID=UPI004034542E
MNAARTPAPDASPPAPRRTRGGSVIVGPTVRARFLPGALIGLPLVSVLLSPFAGAGLQQWRSSRLRSGQDGLLEDLLAPAWTQLLLGALALWVLFSLWALVPLLLTHRVVLLDERNGRISLRRGLRSVDSAVLSQVDYAVGEAERGGMALIGLRDAVGAADRARGGDGSVRQWVVPGVGWDGESFDGLRVLQASVGLTPAPPRAELVRENRRLRLARSHRELADRLGMPWREEYEHDEAAFQAEFDRVRRVLGGRERRRDGDPAP